MKNYTEIHVLQYVDTLKITGILLRRNLAFNLEASNGQDAPYKIFVPDCAAITLHHLIAEDGKGGIELDDLRWFICKSPEVEIHEWKTGGE